MILSLYLIIPFLASSFSQNISEADVCCGSTTYSNWVYCSTGAGLWGWKDCSQCASYQCIDWSVGSKLMTQRESSFKSSSKLDVYLGVGSYGNNNARAGKCYRLSVNGVAKDLIVQAVNQGGDVPDGNFDLQMGDGGFGIYNGCSSGGTSVPQYPGSDSQWGNKYGGWYSESDCSKLPDKPVCSSSSMDSLIDLCHWSFQKGLRNGNPKINRMCEVKCPSELWQATGLHRSDEANSGYECNGAISSGGELTRMMDCSKPSFAWPSNVKGTTYPGYEQVVPCRRDGYTRINAKPK